MIGNFARKNTRAWIPGMICLLILSVILIAGLWPFRGPRNGATWLGNENGLHFAGRATLWSAGSFQNFAPSGEESCTIEFWVQPGLARDSNTILSFSQPENPRQLTIHQYFSLIILNTESPAGQHRTATIGTDGVFHQSQPVFVTVTSDPQQSAIYVNGVLKRAFPQFRLAKYCSGQLVLGTSPVADDSWRGQFRGLALYSRALPPAEVLQHFESWTTHGRPNLSSDDRAVALYLFDARAGSVVHNAVPAGIDLFIPERYALVHQTFLKPFWREFTPTRSYLKDVLINVGGFIPLGLVFCAYWSLARPINRAVLVTTAFGLAVSLTIEVLQSYLPTRESGTTDLFTNTLGTFLGAWMCQWPVVRFLVAKIYAWR